MRNELMTLKMENEKLQSIVVQRAPSSVAGNINNDITTCEEIEADRRPLSTMSDNRYYISLLPVRSCVRACVCVCL